MKFSSTAQYMIANNSRSETTAQDIDLLAFIADIYRIFDDLVYNYASEKMFI